MIRVIEIGERDAGPVIFCSMDWIKSFVIRGIPSVPI
jgi:hypothetical protein